LFLEGKPVASMRQYSNSYLLAIYCVQLSDHGPEKCKSNKKEHGATLVLVRTCIVLFFNERRDKVIGTHNPQIFHTPHLFVTAG